MSKPNITITTCESGDWQILEVDLGEGGRWSWHSIRNHDWIKLLKTLGFEVEQIEITNEEMEELC